MPLGARAEAVAGLWQMGVEESSAANGTLEARPWWELRLCLALVILATMLPLLYPTIPPLVDLFGHMGRYRVELDLNQSSWLQLYYNYHWAAIGNLGVDLLIIPLGKLLGLEPAVKLIVVLIPPITAAGFLWVAREVHGRIPPTAFFALPFIYGYPFMFGFVNFALSVALAFVAFGLWLRLGRLERTVIREWLFVPISLVVFFAHTYGWGLLGSDVLLRRCRQASRQRPQLVASGPGSRASHIRNGISDPHHAGVAKRNPRRPHDRLVRLED